jgi:hypothetical protein
MNYLEITESGPDRAIAARNGTSLATSILEAVGLSRYATPGRFMPESVNVESPSTTGRSLVPLTQPAGEGMARAHGVRPLATFLAQLVAAAQGAPQTRARRRASADHAAALYAAADRRDRPGVLKASM